MTELPAISDPIPLWTAWARKMITMHAVSRGQADSKLSPAEFVERVSAIQSRAQAAEDMATKTAGFWAMENLAAEFLRRSKDGADFRDGGLPLAVRPIVHCGMGIAAVEVARFNPARLTELIEGVSNPDYRLFAYEGAGAMMALYEQDWFGLSARGFSALGFFTLAPMEPPPDPERFLKSFSPEIRLLLAHGYGRLLYFKNHSIASAIRVAWRRPWFDFHSCVRGIAFAYAMVNNSDLGRVFRAPDGLADPDLRGAFEDGLVYALHFWEWMAPGFLDRFNRSREAPELGARASRTLEEPRRDGVLPAFSITEAPASRT